MQTVCFCLDRGWRFTLSQQSVLPSRITHETIYAFSKGNGAQGPAGLTFDDSAWERVDLPHDWQHLTPLDLTGNVSHGYHPTGVGWYRRAFTLCPQDEGKELQLRFDGISGVSDVYFNGAKLKHNESCYNGFTLSLTDLAHFGAAPNVIAIRVDKTQWEGWWYEGCGVNRHVWLYKRPRLHVAPDGLWVKPLREASGAWRLACETTAFNASPQQARGRLCLRAFAPDGREVARMEAPLCLGAYEERTIQTQRAVSAPQLWSPETPTLYTLQAEICGPQGTDMVETRFGLRHIRVDAERGFFLNDQPLKLLGVCNHQDHAGVGAAIPKDLWRYRLERLKAMGCNAYRCSHNPPPPELLELCDEMGLLVIDENRAYSTSDSALSLLRAMVRRDRNHPCVAFYSLFNEEPLQGAPQGRRLALRQMAEVRKLDDTRPLLGAFNGGFFEETGAGTCVDVTGINYFVDSYDAFHARFPTQPLMASEIASAYATRGECQTSVKEQVFGNFDEECAPWGETARAANQAVLSRPFVMGLFVWTGFDYRGEPTPYEWPSVSSHFGILDMCGFPKDVYDLYRAFWRKAPCIHVLPHWNHPEGKRVRVETYSNCEETELLLNGASLGRKKNSPAAPARWDVPFAPGALEAVGYRDGKPAATDARRTAGPPRQLRLTPLVPALFPDTDSIAPIAIAALDEEGNPCPLAKTRVTITVTGGRLAGVGNGDPNCHDPDDAAACRLFHGLCQALVVALPGAKEVRVTATGSGLPKATLSMPVQSRPFPESLAETDTRLVVGWRVSHAAQREPPDPAASPAANDMNSMEPISFTGVPQAQLDEQDGFYCLYQARADLGQGAGRHLLFSRIKGDARVFCDGQLLAAKHCFVEESLEIPLPPSLGGKRLVSVALQNRTVDQRAGILDPVTLITQREGGFPLDAAFL